MSRRRLSIRAKVALASLLLLAIPWIGYRYIAEMENHLRDGLEETVAGAAAALAGALHDRPDILPPEGIGAPPGPADVPVHALEQPMEIDGYDADWAGYLAHASPLAPLPGPARAPGAVSAGASLVAGKHGRHLYLHIEVRDDVLAFGNPEIPGRADSDRVRLRAIDARGRAMHFVLTSLTPGWVGAYEVTPVRAFDPTPATLRRPETRIRAAWQRRPEGYVMEIKAPLGLVSPRLAVDVIDVDQRPRTVAPAILSSAAGAADGAPGTLRLPSATIEGVIRGLGRTQGRRIRVVDARGRVVARGGALVGEGPSGALGAVLSLVLRPPAEVIRTTGSAPMRLTDPVVAEALAGRSARRWRTEGDGGLFVVIAAEPVLVGDAVAGAVIVEESTSGIVAAGRETFAGLLQDTLAVLALVTLLFALLATRLASRIRRLRDEADAAIDAHGRVVGTLSAERAEDEIGDLGRAFAAMLERLRHHNLYLENLARRLSHELRTPIAVTRSSLDALEADSGGDREVYLARARDGLHRLDRILTRMSEASRLEQALADTDREPVDLAALVSASARAYGEAWPDTRFEYRGPERGVNVFGSEDLLVQALDKLVANARDFHTPGTTVDLAVDRSARHVSVSVFDRGPGLPAAGATELFEPMVSVREPGAVSEPHLGLGLYIVRLITAFHGGTVAARERDGGVEIRLDLPVPVADPRPGAPRAP